MAGVTALLWLAGCGTPGTPAEPQPPEREAPPGEASPNPPGEVLSSVMGQLVRGERSLGTVVDRDRGLAYVLWQVDASDQDPRRGPDGIIRVAERLCGEALDQAIARLDRDLRARTDAATGAPSFRCDDDTCRHPARMEYDVDGAYTFGAVDPPRLDRVVRIEGGLTETARADAERWAQAELARLGAEPCPR